MSWLAAATIGSALIEAKAARDASKKQMRFQEDMSNTSYQRAMADMRKAGLNPILAGKLGGASTPPGSMARTPDLSGAVQKAFGLHEQKKVNKANIENTEAQTRLTNAKAMLDEQKVAGEHGTHSAFLIQNQNKQVQHNIDLLKHQKENWKIKNTLQHWESNWYREIYKAPKATLVAKPLNYIMSSAMSGLPEHERQRMLSNVHKGIKLMNDNVEYYMKHPDKLIDAIGTTAALLLTKSISEAMNITFGGKNDKNVKGKKYKGKRRR